MKNQDNKKEYKTTITAFQVSKEKLIHNLNSNMNLHGIKVKKKTGIIVLNGSYINNGWINFLDYKIEMKDIDVRWLDNILNQIMKWNEPPKCIICSNDLHLAGNLGIFLGDVFKKRVFLCQGEEPGFMYNNFERNLFGYNNTKIKRMYDKKYKNI